MAPSLPCGWLGSMEIRPVISPSALEYMCVCLVVGLVFLQEQRQQCSIAICVWSFMLGGPHICLTQSLTKGGCSTWGG